MSEHLKPPVIDEVPVPPTVVAQAQGVPQEHSPFGSEYSESSEFPSSSRFNLLVGNPEYVIKEMTPEWVSKNISERLPEESTPDFLKRVAGHGKTVQREFSHMTGINSPESALLIAKNEEGQELLYRVAQRIHGPNLKEAIQTGRVPESAVKDLFDSMFTYYKEKDEDGTDFAVDTQYITAYRYGRTSGESDDSIQRVDTDPIYGDGWKKQEPETSPYTIGIMFRGILDSLEEVYKIRRYDFIPELEDEVEDYMHTHGIFD